MVEAASFVKSIVGMGVIRTVNLASIDLNLLVALEALLEERSVGAAGRRVGLSQPAMSHALRRLRELLDDPLLVRSGTGMAPTPLAENLAPALSFALKQISDLLRPSAFEPKTSTRNFRMGLTDEAALVVLPRLQAHLARHAPNVSLDVLPLEPGPEGLAALGPKLDLAITREDLLPRGFHREALFEDEAVLALARPPRKRLTLMPFLAGPHVAISSSPERADPVDAWLATLGRTRRISVVVPHCVLALQLVSRSDLMAVLPRSLVERFRAGLGLVAHRLPIAVDPFTQFLLHPERMNQDPGNVWLRQVLLRLFKAQRPERRKTPSSRTILALSPKGWCELGAPGRTPRPSGRPAGKARRT